MEVSYFSIKSFWGGDLFSKRSHVLLKEIFELLGVAVEKIGLDADGACAVDVFLAVVDEKRLFGRNAVGVEQVVENARIGLDHVQNARKDQPVKVGKNAREGGMKVVIFYELRADV